MLLQNKRLLRVQTALWTEPESSARTETWKQISEGQLTDHILYNNIVLYIVGSTVGLVLLFTCVKILTWFWNESRTLEMSSTEGDFKSTSSFSRSGIYWSRRLSIKTHHWHKVLVESIVNCRHSFQSRPWFSLLLFDKWCWQILGPPHPRLCAGLTNQAAQNKIFAFYVSANNRRVQMYVSCVSTRYRDIFQLCLWWKNWAFQAKMWSFPDINQGYKYGVVMTLKFEQKEGVNISTVCRNINCQSLTRPLQPCYLVKRCCKICTNKLYPPRCSSVLRIKVTVLKQTVPPTVLTRRQQQDKHNLPLVQPV